MAKNQDEQKGLIKLYQCNNWQMNRKSQAGFLWAIKRVCNFKSNILKTV
jgi:hypothetical protein